MSNDNGVKAVKLENFTVEVDRVFSDEKLDKLGIEFCFHNFPSPFDEKANMVLLSLLTIKHFTNFPFKGNLAYQLAQYEMMLEDGSAEKIQKAFNKREIMKINKAIKKGTEHTANIVNYLSEVNPQLLTQMANEGK